MLDMLSSLVAHKAIARILGPVLLLGVLIFVHEFGHFLFAKLFGVGVEKFSFGFGPRIVGFTWRGTEYRISWIPLGGYVKMVGDDPFEEQPEHPPENGLQQRPAWQRFLIFVGGPVFNLLLPILLFAGLYMMGPPERLAWVGRFTPNSPAQEAGLQPGDRIVKVGDTPVRFFEELQKAIAAIPPGETAVMVVERDGKRFQVAVPVKKASQGETDDAGEQESTIGIVPLATVADVGVQEGTPAADAGLESRTNIKAVDRQPVTWWFEVDRRLREARGRPVQLEVERDGERRTLTLSPRESHRFMPAPTFADVLEPVSARDLVDALPGAPYGLFPAEIFVDRVVPDRPAGRAGIQAGDMILKINGQVIREWTDIQKQVEAAETRTMRVIVLRHGQLVPISVAPEAVTVRGPGGRPRTTYQIGIVSAGLYKAAEATLKLGPLPALARGTRETFRICSESLQILLHILLGDVPLSESLGGPISIVTVASRSAAMSIFHYLRVMALISVSLGLINLFPIPLLDGGHIMFLFLEFVRGKPVSMRFREISQQIGLIILFLLMAFALANDVRINYFR